MVASKGLNTMVLLLVLGNIMPFPNYLCSYRVQRLKMRLSVMDETKICFDSLCVLALLSFCSLFATNSHQEAWHA